ncbi:phage holin [Paraliobacillus sp. X-1268]|uniref:phage holin n=1 Tax=Paraliobacillus sp. X-1268 TaxID=2213193 RepID=UPI000E3D410F|nr:phage holin [Paraliobacillus sp. X-1268]
MDKGTVVRTIALAIAWVNALLAQYGLQPIPVIDEESIAYGLAFLASVWTWFKNNYVTIKGKQQREQLRKNGLAK